MERRKFTREFKLEAVRLIRTRDVSYGLRVSSYLQERCPRRGFLATLRHDRIEAPCMIDEPIKGESFPGVCRADPAAHHQARRYRDHRQSRQPQAEGRTTPHPRRRSEAVLPAALQP